MENDPSGQPILGIDPNCVGIHSIFSTDNNLLVITIDITFDVTSNKFNLLQLFGLVRSPYFCWIFRKPLCHSFMFISSLKYCLHISNKVRLFSSFGEIPLRPPALWRVSFFIASKNSRYERGNPRLYVPILLVAPNLLSLCYCRLYENAFSVYRSSRYLW